MTLIFRNKAPVLLGGVIYDETARVAYDRYYQGLEYVYTNIQ